MTISWKEVCRQANIFEPSEGLAKSSVMFLYVVDGLSLRQIVTKLNNQVTDRTIARMLKREGVTLRPRGGRNYVKDMHISEEEYLNLTYKELCKKYDISTVTVRRLTKHYKPKPKLGRRPAAHGDDPLDEHGRR